MPRGQSDIPELRLEVLQNYFETFVSPPELVLSSMFPSSNSPSSTVKWESHRGGRGVIDVASLRPKAETAGWATAGRAIGRLMESCRRNRCAVSTA